MPPTPVSVNNPRLWSRPNPQPVSTRGKVSQFGTLNFQASMTAATIIATLRNNSGQFARVNKAIRRHLHASKGKKGLTNAPALRVVRCGVRSESPEIVGRPLHRTPPLPLQHTRVR